MTPSTIKSSWTAPLAVSAIALMLAGHAAAGELRIESWRSDDVDIWNDTILPVFHEKHPDIQVVFAPTPPADYNAGLNAKLAGGTAGDIITCRPFDASLDLFKQGQIIALNDLEGMANFSDVAKSAWQTDDGADTFCLPMASVIHGFMYNKEAFEELGVEPPKTIPEFMALLAKIEEEGSYTPLSLGTADQWEAATMGFQNVGPNFWNGEDGRKALIAGDAKLTDDAYVATFAHLAEWAPYMGNGYQAQKYSDSQNLFTLGRAAIYPAGSWDIATFNDQAIFEFGAFAPPVPEGADECYISDHTDIAMGINAASANQEDAKLFLEWTASAEFAELYANSLPGFFSLSSHAVELTDPVAQEFVSWREQCNSTIRNSYQILSRGTPNLENELWNVSAQVLNGTLSPEEAADQVQSGLAKWYEPQQ
ncbi:MAG: ABC transporter substrate-binding protein [Alphaproteobacteria bacterium]|nr:ABC transporter substrate-binding protein [Alphaproteobacteria bacterium]